MTISRGRQLGKPVFDVFINKVVAYEMPRHFIDIHSQRRIRTLDSHDDLTLPEFLQGYVAMLSKMRSDDPVYHAMVWWLGPLGQALVDYQWHDMRDWINSVLHDVGQGRLSWLDEAVIADRLNTAKLRASVKAGGDDPVIPVCALYNQGRCSHEASHGVFKHVCALCFVAQGIQYSHSAQTCRRKHSNNQQANNRQYNRDTSQSAQGSPYHSNNNRHHSGQGRDRKHGEGGSYSTDSQPGSHTKN